ncbi:MAG: chemoreceptor glutamine deamidase CheD [Gammaproteobacteria bacterium]
MASLTSSNKNNTASPHRYWDEVQKRHVVKIQPGEFYVAQGHEIISTTVGSCIAACLYEPIAGVAGMNHFLLPIKSMCDINASQGEIFSNAARYGNWAMEYLINEMLKRGSVRENIQAKIYGGCSSFQSERVSIGKKNIMFVLQYLQDEMITLAEKDVGGKYPRKVAYHTWDGTVKLIHLKHDFKQANIAEQEQQYLEEIKHTDTDGDIELF